MTVGVQMTERAPDSETPLPEVARIHDIEPGESPSITAGFDSEALKRLDPESLIDQDAWDGEGKIARLKAVLDNYSRLPESMRFDAGVTAIFGENGAGKTLLADVIIMALNMELYRQENGLRFGDPILADHRGGGGMFRPRLPGRLMGGSEDLVLAQTEHALLVAKIAECMRVHEASLVSKKSLELSSALRSPAALGNVAVGMSSRQAIDYLKGTQLNPNGKASVVLYDEPELGMSPRRQRQLAEELKAQSSGVVELVPSNSIVLFNSDLPRIDLDTPEKGVFTSSE